MGRGHGATRGGGPGGGVSLGATEAGQSAALSKALLQREKQIQGSGVENVAIFDENGNLLFQHTDNATNYVTYDGRIAHGNVHTHNHTNNTSFSPDDIVNTVKTDMREARVTTPTYTYSLKRPEKGWGVSKKKLESSLYGKSADLQWEMRKYISRYKGDKSVAIARAERMFTHILTKQVAKEYGWSYTKRKS